MPLNARAIKFKGSFCRPRVLRRKSCRAVAEPRTFFSRGIIGSCDIKSSAVRRTPLRKHLLFTTTSLERCEKVTMATLDPSTGKMAVGKTIIPSIEVEASEPPSRSSPTRGRKRRRHSAVSASPTRSPSPSRGHGRKSGSRHRDKRRWRHHRTTSSERSDFSSPSRQGSAKKVLEQRRRSDAEADHTFRGRPRNRSRSRTKSVIEESGNEEAMNEAEEMLGKGKMEVTRRKRSLPPSRGSRTPNTAEDQSPEYRRQRSLPNQYRGVRVDEEMSTDIQSTIRAG